MTAVKLKLKIGPSNTVQGPFALVGTSAELLKLAKAIELAVEDDHAPGEPFEVWIGRVQYGPDFVALELDKLLKKVRGEDPES